MTSPSPALSTRNVPTSRNYSPALDMSPHLRPSSAVDHVAHHLPISHSADSQRGEHFMDKYYAALHQDARRMSLERGESYANLTYNFRWVLPPFHAGASYEPRWIPALIEDDEIPALLEVSDEDDDDNVPDLVDPYAVPAHKHRDVPALVNTGGAFPPTFMYSPTSQLAQGSVIGRFRDGASTINYIVPPTLNSLAHTAQCRYLLSVARATRDMRDCAYSDGEFVERVWWREDSSPTKPADLAIACTACPRPGLNDHLDGWDDRAMFLAMDTNRRLQHIRTDGEVVPFMIPSFKELKTLRKVDEGHSFLNRKSAIEPQIETAFPTHLYTTTTLQIVLGLISPHLCHANTVSRPTLRRFIIPMLFIPRAAKLDAKLDTDSSAKITAKLKTNSSKARGRCSPAQLAAMRTYRDKNQETLRAKARERMARRREATLEGDSAQEYRARARAASQRHRERNADVLANNQRVRRAEKFINTHGMAAWTAAYDKRYIKQHGLEAWTALLSKSAQQEPASCTDELPSTSPDDPDHELHDFLDNHDPTTRPDYVPNPGERRYFQRGKYRWY
ncbi:hypothetical protein C8R47DRAFT_1067218 [Mycena vitilis]|nr:hypothetical protein C8R47DRAFT_1076825 [Mycena vitilis]KAJ6504289.1 hypothetical protein C8R47DRAFT_1067218 [Mycena vitilis]